MTTAITTIKHPTIEPITLEEAKQHLRVVDTDDDALIMICIQSARSLFEGQTGLILNETTFVYSADAFANVIKLHRNPVIAVDEITYFDVTGQATTLNVSDCHIDKRSFPARIVPVSAFPSVDGRPGGVNVTFRAGYTTDNPMPPVFKSALLLMVGHFYENREEVLAGVSVNEMPFAAKYLMEQHAIKEL